jgi:hypothetical protein
MFFFEPWSLIKKITVIIYYCYFAILENDIMLITTTLFFIKMLTNMMHPVENTLIEHNKPIGYTYSHRVLSDL